MVVAVPKRRERVGHAGLMKANDVHVPFNDQQARQGLTRLARFIQSIEFLALVKDAGLGRIHVFRFALIDDAPAEGDHAPARIANRKHDPVAKPIVKTAVRIAAPGRVRSTIRPAAVQLAARARR